MPDHECSFCHGVGSPSKACSGCKEAWYCSGECQRADWTRHKLDCKPSKPVPTADYLALAVNQNRLPEHPQTCIDYGFTRTKEPLQLLGLYIGLMKKNSLDIKPQTLHKWRLNDTLVENIKARFQTLPEGSRGEYYSWFLRNQHVVSDAGVEEDDREAHECSFCHETELPTKQFSGCKKSWYCSGECQRDHWLWHIFDCKPSRPITTADYLALAVAEDLVPEHPQTCEDYGFTRTGRKAMLLGLYIGRMQYLGVKPQTVHKLRVNGTLVQNIKAKFETMPEQSRGGYYSWFLQNQDVVSGAGGGPEDGSQSGEMFRRAWLFIGRSPTTSVEDICAYLKTASEEEKNCFFLYAMLLSHSYPGPKVDQWIQFGFCACTHQNAEMELSRSYTMLINQCTFDQFLDAYTSGSLASLFKEKRVDIADPLIVNVLSGMGNKSVWSLKRYIELKKIHGPEDEIKLPLSIGWDYGFWNCKTTEEHKLLVDVYKGFFAGRNPNPVQLHEACVQGRLFTYFAQEMGFKLKPRKTYERLLANAYPLKDPGF